MKQTDDKAPGNHPREIQPVYRPELIPYPGGDERLQQDKPDHTAQD